MLLDFSGEFNGQCGHNSYSVYEGKQNDLNQY